jgi:glutamyl-tRNA synthetase
MSVVTRIAPSPTGEMHIGTVRTALFNYLYAKHFGGTYFVRIEDTDKERNKPEWVEAIWRDFEWCGIIPDARYVQSEHLERHRELLRALVDSGKAYVSPEPAKDDPSRTVEVVRLRNPGTSVTFEDLIRGSVTFDTTELGDFVIARSVDDPLYHFAVVVDDNDAGVTHVLRAEEHISNTPRQILIQEALGFPRPIYGHFPLILAPDRSKLSKRKHGASIDKYRAQGYLPEAIINYLALLGWNPGTEQELFSLPELVALFDIEKVHRAGAIFDIEKLRWFNEQYLAKLSEPDYERAALERLNAALGARALQWNDQIAARIVPLLKERVSVWGDIDAMAGEGEFDFFFTAPKLDPARIPDKRSDAATAARHLDYVLTALHDTEPFTADAIKQRCWDYATEQGRGAVLWPLRYALSGREKSPDPFAIASVIGKDETLSRITSARRLLGN